jgi:hypothetical protein
MSSTGWFGGVNLPAKESLFKIAKCCHPEVPRLRASGLPSIGYVVYLTTEINCAVKMMHGSIHYFCILSAPTLGVVTYAVEPTSAPKDAHDVGQSAHSGHSKQSESSLVCYSYWRLGAKACNCPV